MGRRNILYIGTNTKMYMTSAQAAEYIERLRESTDDIAFEALRLFVLPSFTSIPAASCAARGSRLIIGAQNICYEDEGEFTGEISGPMLEEAGAEMVMVGHAERRHIFGEGDQDIRRKVKYALDKGFTVLLCVGEKAEDKEYGISVETLTLQLKLGLYDVLPQQAAERLWIAYEPVWAIGKKGVTADVGYVNAIHQKIKRVLKERFGEEIGSNIPVLYGGSIGLHNAKCLISMPSVDGLFIGRGAWDTENFNEIIRQALQQFKERATSET